MYRNLDGRVIGERSLDQPEPTKRQQARQDELDQAARDEFDDYIGAGLTEQSKRAWLWVCDKIIDAPAEVQRIVHAALWHVLRPKSEDASFELTNAVDALRERYVAEREWHWSEFATEGDDEY